MGDADRLSPKHDSVALLALLGVAPDEIAEALGLDQRQVRVLVSSPLFRRLAESGRASILAQAGNVDATAFIDAETLPSLQKISDLRDAAVDERVQLRAAQDLADRNPATARLSRGRSLRESPVSEHVATYIESLTRMKDQVALPANAEAPTTAIVLTHLEDEIAAMAEPQ